MKQNYIPLIDGAFFIDNSFLEESMACMRLAEYEVFRRLRISEPRSALAYGGIIHKALEVRYASGEPLVSTDLEGQMIASLEEGFETYTPPEGDFRTLEQATSQILAYNKTYPVENFKPVVRGLRTEVPFAIPFGEFECNKELPVWDLSTDKKEVRFIDTLPIFFSGRIDLVYETLSGQVEFMDHKTSSMKGMALFDPFYTGTQMKGYCWALSHLLGRPVRKYTINALVGRKPTKTGTQFDFMRDTHMFSDGHIEEWEQTAKAILNRLFSAWSKNYFPMEPKWCVGKFGKCPFFDVCMLPPDQRETMLTSGMFEVNDWNPIDDPKKAANPNDGVLFL